MKLTFRRTMNPVARQRSLRLQAKACGAGGVILVVIGLWALRAGRLGSEVEAFAFAGAYFLLMGVLIWRARRLPSQARPVELFPRPPAS